MEQQYDELFTAGRLLDGAHHQRSMLSKAGVHLELTARYGTRLLFEVEQFRAEEFGSRADAVALLGECAATALATVESDLGKRTELAVHPQWRSEILDAVREAHEWTLARLRMTPTAAEPPPPHRWRLPPRAHDAAWQQLTDRCPTVKADRRSPDGHDWDSRHIIAGLREHGLRRVLVLHQLMPRHSCETDVELLARHKFDWMDIVETYLTADPFDWFIHLGEYGEWDATGWPK